MIATCAVCGGRTRETHTGVVLGTHPARYLMCESCDFWFAENPDWLDQAYSSAIAATDTGLATRNLQVRDALTPALTKLFDPSGVFVDYAGGYGLLVRLMRDRGFDFRWQDAYAENLFAGGLEWTAADTAAGKPVEAVTAIEVLEHTVDPVAFVDEIVAATGTDSILFSQQLHHGVDTSWWYLAPETGQHISFFSEKTLLRLAGRVGMNYHGAGWLHLFTKRDLPAGAFARHARAPGRLARLRGTKHLPSLAVADHDRAVRNAGL